MVNSLDVGVNSSRQQLELAGIIVVAPHTRGMQPQRPAANVLDSFMGNAANGVRDCYEVLAVPLEERVFGEEEQPVIVLAPARKRWSGLFAGRYSFPVGSFGRFVVGVPEP